MGDQVNRRDWAAELPPGTLLCSKTTRAPELVIYVNVVEPKARPRKTGSLSRLWDAMFDVGLIPDDDTPETTVLVFSLGELNHWRADEVYDAWWRVKDAEALGIGDA